MACPSALLPRDGGDPMRRVLKWLGYGVIGIAVLLAGAWALLRTPDIPIATLKAKYGSPASRYVELSPGTIIHMRDEGPRSGLPVVLVHGSNASLHTWEPWRARLTARGYRVITMDLPAHGLSGPTPDGRYSHDAYVGIIEQLVDRLALTRFALGGNSMGGGVAWRYAVKHPDRLAALILVDAGGLPQPGNNDPPLAFRIARMPIVRDIAATVTPRSLIETSFKASISNQAIATPAMVDRYWELLLYPGNRAATIARFSQYDGASVDPERLRTLRVPTLILWGAEDRLIPVGVAAFFSQRIPGSRVSILDGIGHIPMEEAPDRSLAPVLDVLERAGRQ